jgi:FMN-dependent NADH-azoreductase
MTRLLHISASPNGAASHSRLVGGQLVAGLRRLHDAQVTRRDLVADPLPYPGPGFVSASLMPEPERGPAQKQALSLSEVLIAELETADVVVIDTPMHNFTVPAGLKTWIDYVVRPNRTFRIAADGKHGLLDDRPVFAVIACGGGFDPGAGGQTDFLTPYLCHVLATIGLRSVHVLRLENLRRGEAAVSRSLASAEAWMQAHLADTQMAPRLGKGVS